MRRSGASMASPRIDVDAELDQPRVLHDRRWCLQRHGQTLTVPSRSPARAVTYSSRHGFPHAGATKQRPHPGHMRGQGVPGRCVGACGRTSDSPTRPASCKGASSGPSPTRPWVQPPSRTSRASGLLLQRRDQGELPRRCAAGAELTCTAEVVSGGRRVAFVEASVTGPRCTARRGAAGGPSDVDVHLQGP